VSLLVIVLVISVILAKIVSFLFVLERIQVIYRSVEVMETALVRIHVHVVRDGSEANANFSLVLGQIFRIPMCVQARVIVPMLTLAIVI
jgi:hypothetical protein